MFKINAVAELATELDQLINAFLETINEETVTVHELILREFLWDNKVGLLRVCEGYASIVEGLKKVGIVLR